MSTRTLKRCAKSLIECVVQVLNDAPGGGGPNVSGAWSLCPGH